MGVIKQNRYDARRCLMQLQYDSGVVKNRSQLSKSSSPNASGSSRGDNSSPAVAVAESSSSGIGTVTPVSPTPGSPMRRKPQRLMRISAKSIIPASAPTLAAERKKVLPSPMQELEQLEVQLQYADTMSLSDSCLRMRSDRILQVNRNLGYSATRLACCFPQNTSWPSINLKSFVTIRSALKGISLRQARTMSSGSTFKSSSGLLALTT